MVRGKIKAQDQDIRRTIQREKKRFISILIITVLGVMMFSGLKAGCVDLRKSADRFFDEQQLHDLFIQSTLGLTEEDVAALQSIDGIEYAEGVYSKEVQMTAGAQSLRISLETLTTTDIDLPYVKEGRMPHEDHEVLATEKFLADTGLKVGDTFRIEEETEEGEGPAFAITEFRITGSAVDVRDINNPFGSIAFRTTPGADVVFVTRDAVQSSIYTGVSLTIDGTREMFCFTKDYEDVVRQLETIIEEEVKTQREEARTKEVREMAEEQIKEAEEEVQAQLQQALDQLQDAQEEMEDALQQLRDGQKELDENRGDALKQLENAQKTIDENRRQLAEAKKQLDDAKKEIEDGTAQLEAGQKELDVQKAAAQQEIQDGKALLDSRYAEASAGAAAVENGAEELRNGLAQLLIPWPKNEYDACVQVYSSAYEAAMREDLTKEPVIDPSVGAQEKQALLAKTAAMKRRVQLVQNVLKIVSSGDTAGIQELLKRIEGGEEIAAMLENADATQAQLEELVQAIDSLPMMVEGYGQAKAGMVVLEEQKELLLQKEEEANTAFAQAQQTIDENRKKLADGKAEYESGLRQYTDGAAKLEAGQKELDAQRADTLKQLEDAQKEIDEGCKQIEEGKEELEDGWKEYYEGEEEARQRFADAREKLKELDTASWYVQNRKSLSGYANVQSDADSIEAIGTAFPVVFLIVAVLMSLTTITRMVEEERGLIGTYKSLGYTDGEILKKYLVYAGAACAGGSLIGTFMAFVGLPLFLFWVFGIMYVIPRYHVSFLWSFGLLGPVIFLGGILLAVWLACRSALKQTPAVLMRPKAPKEGSRVFLEYITPLWKRMSFLNKVTARNLFRYKKRMFMTIFGIAGCMSLLLFGFSIRDSVTDLVIRQYEETFRYDLLAAGLPTEYERLAEEMENDVRTEDQIGMMISQVTLQYGDEQNVQLMVFPDAIDLSDYMNLEDIEDQKRVLTKGTVLITRNASNILGFREGDEVQIRMPDLQTGRVKVTGIVKNYLGNYIYMNQSTYEEYFEDYALNGLLMHTSGQCTDEDAFVKELKNRKGVTSVLSTEQLKAEFSQAFRLINFVVYVVITMSALLAFVVLFTLAATNVSEREREIATIKVLGFFDREVHAYIDKETLILTGIGMLAGIPLGYLFAQTLTWILNLPSIYLAVSLHTASYGMAAGLVAVFALLVQIFTDRSLNEVDPVTALKSVE